MSDQITVTETIYNVTITEGATQTVTVSPTESLITITEPADTTTTVTTPASQIVTITQSASIVGPAYTDADARAAISATGAGLSYSSSTGVMTYDQQLVSVAKGGTGATDAATARTNLGTNDASNLTTGNLASARVSTIPINSFSDVSITKTANNIVYTDGSNVRARPASNWNLTDFTNDLTSGDLPAHTHAATDITSGTLSISVIPDLSGTYALASHTHTMSDITDLGDLEINDLANVNVAMGAGNDGDLLFYDHAAGAGAKIKGVARSSIDLSEFNNDLPAVADSYVMMIEVPSDKTYYLDPKVIAARTITSFYAKTSAGTCTAWLKQGGSSVGLIAVTTSGGTSSVTNTSVSANAVIQVDVSSTSSAEDLQIMVGYTQ